MLSVPADELIHAAWCEAVIELGDMRCPERLLYKGLRPLVFYTARQSAPATASQRFELTSVQELLIARLAPRLQHGWVATM